MSIVDRYELRHGCKNGRIALRTCSGFVANSQSRILKSRTVEFSARARCLSSTQQKRFVHRFLMEFPISHMYLILHAMMQIFRHWGAVYACAICDASFVIIASSGVFAGFLSPSSLRCFIIRLLGFWGLGQAAVAVAAVPFRVPLPFEGPN